MSNVPAPEAKVSFAEIDARINALMEQRNVALNEVVILKGLLAKLESEKQDGNVRPTVQESA